LLQPLVAGVEELGSLPTCACERVDDDRDVPGDTPVDVLVEKPRKLGGELPGDLLRDLGSSNQSQRHGVGALTLGGSSFTQVCAPYSVFTSHRTLTVACSTARRV